jgi:hypothetical protein
MSEDNRIYWIDNNNKYEFKVSNNVLKIYINGKISMGINIKYIINTTVVNKYTFVIELGGNNIQSNNKKFYTDKQYDAHEIIDKLLNLL